jgi:hypothetical protein
MTWLLFDPISEQKFMKKLSDFGQLFTQLIFG